MGEKPVKKKKCVIVDACYASYIRYSGSDAQVTGGMYIATRETTVKMLRQCFHKP